MLIAQMIGRNESERYLKQVLARLVPLVDVVCFTDDCSDDDTPQIAKDMGCKVFQMDKPTFTVHEGELRKTAWDFMCNEVNPVSGQDWVLAIDCDEELYGTEHLGEMLSQNEHDVLGIAFYHMWNATQFRIDKAWSPTMSSRLFRYFNAPSWNMRRLACGAEPEYVQRLIRAQRFNTRTGLRMKHLGYMKDEDKPAKYDRYMALDKGEFHALAHLESILDNEPVLIDWQD